MCVCLSIINIKVILIIIGVIKLHMQVRFRARNQDYSWFPGSVSEKNRSKCCGNLLKSSF